MFYGKVYIVYENHAGQGRDVLGIVGQEHEIEDIIREELSLFFRTQYYEDKSGERGNQEEADQYTEYQLLKYKPTIKGWLTSLKQNNKLNVSPKDIPWKTSTGIKFELEESYISIE